MRRQPPIARCFAVLCLGLGVTLAAFEWRNPFPEPIITLDAAPVVILDGESSSDNEQGVADPQEDPQKDPQKGKRRRGLWPFSRLSAEAQSAEAQPDALEQASSVELVLSLSSRSLEVRVADEPPIVYKVAVGQADWQTPTGEFTVLSKQENPTWLHPITKEEIPPGPENPLGTHWIGFWTDGRAQIGFHGTNQEELIGEAVSHGCVRMRNQDVAALYELVELGTAVKVEP